MKPFGIGFLRSRVKVLLSSYSEICNTITAQTSLLRLRSCPFKKVYWLTISCRGETGGERSQKSRSRDAAF